MKRKKPSFNETYYGYRTFSELLEEAQRLSLLELDTDPRSRTYVVTRFGDEMHNPPPASPAPVSGKPRRRRRGRRRIGESPLPADGPETSGKTPVHTPE
jgi:hypothetical protein